MKSEVIDLSETLLAHLLCAESDGIRERVDLSATRPGSAPRSVMAQVNPVAKAGFDPMRPSKSYTMQMNDNDRLFTDSPDYLIHNAIDILGTGTEIAAMDGSRLKWMGYRRIRGRLPRGVWVSGKIGAAYQMHYREVFADGRSTYDVDLVALSPSGKPLACIFEGSQGVDSERGARSAIMAASIIEDTHRSGCFTTTVSESAEIIFPVPYGDQIELFKLRDAPLTPTGRRRAILHWVAAHMRNSRSGRITPIKEHVRGVHEFSTDGLTVRLDPNDAT